MTFRLILRSGLVLLATACAAVVPIAAAPPRPKPVSKPAAPVAASVKAAKKKPLLRNFMGLNTHTVQFRPALYQPVTRMLRDYHNLDWDIGTNTASTTRFPMSQNGVNWQDVYGAWKAAGYQNNVCVQFGSIKPETWKDVPHDARAYGEAFARYFGPSGNNLAQSAEIGNEPGNYEDAAYRTVFENMAAGMRTGDPKLKIATCAVFDKPSGKYHKNLSTVKGLENLYDAINVHSYAQAEPYPTWRRSYPEDPKIPFLKDIEDVIAWRNTNAPGKEVWLTEFGWDATTKPQDKEGTFKNWVGVTDTQQAQYIVRAFLVFSAMDLNRAYLYWFNDGDKPMVHASSGITRNYQPKPSFYAMAHLFQTLGDYRFVRVVRQEAGGLYVYEFQNGDNAKKRVWAVWSPTGTNRTTTAALSGLPGKITKAERMPLAPGAAEPVRYEAGKDAARLEVGESPVYLFIE